MNFTIKEFFVSSVFPDLATDSYEKASKILKASIHLLIVLIMQPLRSQFAVPITITSGYRTDKLNNALRRANYKTAPNSLHTRGIACDFTVDNKALLPVMFQMIKEELPYGELILYMKKGKPDRIHVSLPSDRGHFFKVKEE